MSLRASPSKTRLGCIESIYEAVPDATEVTVWKTITLQKILGYIFTPIALLTGAPAVDATQLGQLYGEKTILNEFYAYFSLMNLTAGGEISPRTAIIASYGLCGFANLSSHRHPNRRHRRHCTATPPGPRQARCSRRSRRHHRRLDDRQCSRPAVVTVTTQLLSLTFSNKGMRSIPWGFKGAKAPLQSARQRLASSQVHT